jgi:hypothetical protein
MKLREGQDPSVSGVTSPSRGTTMHSVPYRRFARKRTAFMNREQVYAAHRLYRRGASVPRIAAAVWRRYGFKNESTCRLSLYKAFASYRLPTKGARGCAECGCAMDERTTGCSACNSRHNFRRLHVPGLPHVVGNTRCSGCGCAYDDSTKGCGVCTRRRGIRAWRARQAA